MTSKHTCGIMTIESPLDDDGEHGYWIVPKNQNPYDWSAVAMVHRDDETGSINWREQKANAEFLVKSWNAYEHDQETIKALTKALASIVIPEGQYLRSMETAVRVDMSAVKTINIGVTPAQLIQALTALKNSGVE